MTTANTLAALVNSSSEVVVPSGGIQFADATNANTVSSQSNLIEQDGYEEGSWTPAELSGQATFSSATGTYTKIGNTVTVHFDYTTSNTGTPQFGGLPFTSTSSMALGVIRENNRTGYMWHVRVNQSATQTIVRRYDNSSTSGNGDRYIGSVTYFAS